MCTMPNAVIRFQRIAIKRQINTLLLLIIIIIIIIFYLKVKDIFAAHKTKRLLHLVHHNQLIDLIRKFSNVTFYIYILFCFMLI